MCLTAFHRQFQFFPDQSSSFPWHKAIWYSGLAPAYTRLPAKGKASAIGQFFCQHLSQSALLQKKWKNSTVTSHKPVLYSHLLLSTCFSKHSTWQCLQSTAPYFLFSTALSSPHLIRDAQQNSRHLTSIIPKLVEYTMPKFPPCYCIPNELLYGIEQL